MKHEININVPSEINDKITALKNSLIFKATNGSHELFHTNIWSGLIEKDHEFIKVFFPEIKGEFVRVEREEGNRDLTIWMKVDNKEVAYVVENKFKSYPREEQLDDYEGNLVKKGKFGAGLLVCLKRPAGSETWRWNVTTQKALAVRILEFINKSTAFDNFDSEYVKKYVAMTIDQSDAFIAYLDAYGKQWPINGSEGLLEDVRLGDIFKKNKTNEFIQDIMLKPEYKSWCETAEKFGMKFVLKPSFSNKNAILNVCFEKDINDKHYSFGIQIQDTQYRRKISTNDVIRFTKPADLFNYVTAQTNDMWFNAPEFPKSESMRDEFCGYGNKANADERFVYQYMILNKFDFESVFARIKIEMTKVVEILKSGSLKF